ncbi:MAG: 30S ribosomal protein S21 [Candidatus Margulisiibacteriota bacterium]|jgi:small subunit ribosomal protein S21
MAVLNKKPGESFDSLLRKFNKKIKIDGVLQEFRKREFFVKPSEVKKEKNRAAKRRSFLQQRANEL